jgi:hypothetical protein
VSQPYCAQADVMNQVLTTLLTDAGWNLVSTLPSAPSDVDLRIQEGDSEIDSRLSALGFTLPFAVNPSILKPLSVLYARYACFRDLYAGGSPSAGTAAMTDFKNQFEEKFQKIEDGWAALVDANGNVIAPANSKFGVSVAKNTAIVDDKPGSLISGYVADSDSDDGLSPVEQGQHGGDDNGNDDI